MFVQEVIIDGFKSYARKTVVEGFDPHFNAITGLNGSGKSNILDAICFVLGITNLSQVRAGNLSELVYKQGQAGVNKATVTIVFNNEDKANSPVGYDQCDNVTVTRQVLLGGKSKYLINGRNAPAGAVQNLFHSVQLNVNNPHFLIMQGRITKVLNMKPAEILGMVEEAAGTRMYETKKGAAIKTIEKKQLKLDELNSVLEEEITPTLEKLRGEKEQYLAWSKNASDLERKERFVIASEFYSAQKALEDDMGSVQKMEDDIARLQAEAAALRGQIAIKEKEIAEGSAQLQGQFEGDLAEAKKREQKVSNELVRITSAWKSAQDTVAKAESDAEAAKSVVAETNNAVRAKEKEIKEENALIDGVRKAASEAESLYKQLSEEYQTMAAGTSSSQEGRSLPEQISQAHSDSKTAGARVEQAKMKMKHLSKELKNVDKELSKQKKSAESVEKKFENSKQKVMTLQEQINGLNFSEAEFNALDQEKSDLEAAVTELEEQLDTLSTQLQGRLSFEYEDPVRGFDRSKVKGLVAKLVDVKDSKYATALEVVAGGRLFQVVVDEAITGKALLERGKLSRRVTIIPLDKIRSNHLSQSACRTAEEVASSMQTTATPAIELVGYDEEVRNAIEYVFGSAIVVDGIKAANKICEITKTRTVTLEGDVYDPSGTISGGSKNQLGSTLSSLVKLSEFTGLLEEKSQRLAQVTGQVSSLQSLSASFEKLSVKLELAKAEFEAVKKQMSQTTYGVLVEKRDSMLADLKLAEEECLKMENEEKQKWSLYEQLKEREIELTQEREQRFADIEVAIKAANADATEKNLLAREAASKTQTLELELESLKTELAAAEEAVKVAEKVLEEMGQQESEMQVNVAETQALYDQARSEVHGLERKVDEFSSQVTELKERKSELSKALEAATIEAKKLSVTIAQRQKERVGAEKVVSNLLKTYAWIESEKGAFGIVGGDYDFESADTGRIAAEVKELRNQQDSLGKKVNKKVMGMIEKAEGEYTELLRKRRVVENDKKKIQNVIEELDVKKKVELERTWKKVNGDFGSIFSTLLPGASAKLEPPGGMAAWEGLEVKVAFGDVWKESLSELSGGQRSLLALSLILAMLLFKPAPMYILDEVDAALDLSHTQNIGNMLRTHFSQSQFIVVSLKEGMFNNANVIFRTKFVDGVSTVTRTIGTGSSRPRALAESENTSMEEDGRGTNSSKIPNASVNRRRGKENSSA